MVLLNSSANKYALIIGINYSGSEIALNGCIYDANNIFNFLVNKCNYKSSNVKLITDNTINKPDKNTILNELRNLVEKAKNENIKEFWFSYSGHGSSVTSLLNIEVDNKDEVLVPYNYLNNRELIYDNELHEILSELPEDCELFSLIDACNSGTVLDLKYVCRLNNNNITFEDQSQSQPNSKLTAKIVKISGCKDNQTSAEDYIDGKYKGVLTTYFLDCASDLQYNCSIKEMITSLNKKIQSLNYSQIPTLTTSNKDLLNNILLKNNQETSAIKIVKNLKEKSKICVIL